MKKITLLFILCLTYFTASFGQCETSTGGFYGNISIVNDGTVQQIYDQTWPNAEYSYVDNLIVGNTYTVTGTNTTSIYITVVEDTPPYTPIAWDASSVTFTAVTEAVYINWHLNVACDTQGSDNTTTTIQCTSPSCACTASSAPGVASAVSPSNNAVNVPVDVTTNPASPRIVFEWSAASEATSYDITIFDPTGAEIGTVSENDTDVTITYSWAYDSTYTWVVKSKNCLGEETSSTFEFTTEPDPTLDVASFDAKSFTVYPNPTTDVLKIQSNETVNSVAVYSLLGKQVMFLKGDQISNNSVNVSNLTKGVYFITIEANGKNEKLKFIKQ
jgi:hypothetical protein